MKQISKFVIAILLLMVAIGGPASAHELLHDSTNKYDAIVHFAPNDEPKPGAATVIHFDLDLDLDLAGSKAALLIIGPNGNKVELQAQLGKHAAAVTYEFPAVGKYYFTLEITPTTMDKLDYNFSQEVAAEAPANKSSAAVFMWFNGTLLILVLSITLYYRRHKKLAP